MKNKNILLIFILSCCLFLITFSFSVIKTVNAAQVDGKHKVIKVVDPDTVIVDFNDNGLIDEDEKCRINGIDGFETHKGRKLELQKQMFNLTDEEALELGRLGTKFAKDNLLNKYVEVRYTGKTKRDNFGRQLVSVYYGNGKNYEEELLKAGFAIVYRKSNIASQLLKFENKDKILSHVKGKQAHPSLDKTSYRLYQQIVNPDAEENNIKLYFLSPLKQDKPVNDCVTNACKSLLYNIDNAKESIDFAIYGIKGQDAIFNALVEAQKRGIKLRWVTDKTENNENIYSDTVRLMEVIKNVNDDYLASLNIHKGGKVYEFSSSAIMHNKFFIFDNKRVFTGSTNISDTCLTGYNANVAVLIDSTAVASLYKQEFEQMYSGRFHNAKTPIPNNENITMAKTVIFVYFSPTDKIATTKIIPILNMAKCYIYVPAFYLTHKEITNALIQAKQRGVDVKVILDQTSVGGKYSTKDILEKGNVDVRVENWKGKMHQKSMIIDDNTLIIGSMNFTKQGEERNDENTLIINNAPILTKAYKKHFMELWKSLECTTNGKVSSHSILHLPQKLHHHYKYELAS